MSRRRDPHPVRGLRHVAADQRVVPAQLFCLAVRAGQQHVPAQKAESGWGEAGWAGNLPGALRSGVERPALNAVEQFPWPILGEFYLDSRPGLRPGLLSHRVRTDPIIDQLRDLVTIGVMIIHRSRVVSWALLLTSTTMISAASNFAGPSARPETNVMLLPGTPLSATRIVVGCIERRSAASNRSCGSCGRPARYQTLSISRIPSWPEISIGLTWSAVPGR